MGLSKQKEKREHEVIERWDKTTVIIKKKEERTERSKERKSKDCLSRYDIKNIFEFLKSLTLYYHNNGISYDYYP